MEDTGLAPEIHFKSFLKRQEGKELVFKQEHLQLYYHPAIWQLTWKVAVISLGLSGTLHPTLENLLQ